MAFFDLHWAKTFCTALAPKQVEQGRRRIPVSVVSCTKERMNQRDRRVRFVFFMSVMKETKIKASRTTQSEWEEWTHVGAHDAKPAIKMRYIMMTKETHYSF